MMKNSNLPTGQVGFLRNFLFIFVLCFSLIWWGCPTKITSPPPTPTKINPPSDIVLVLGALPAGQTAFATISWRASEDTGRSDFRGYRVITQELDTNNKVITVFQVQLVTPSTLTYTVDSLISGKRYKTSVSAELTDNTTSDTISTQVYGAVYYNTDGQIDEMFDNDTTDSQSGYGWPSHRQGYQYKFAGQFSTLIDLHMRANSGGKLTFYSPGNFPPGLRNTEISLVGDNLDAFDQTNLVEPQSHSQLVNLGKVYLLKTEDNYYIKVYVTSIGNPVSTNFKTVKFEYKVQSVQGLRVL
jgi:Fibronectin type III domain